MGFFEQYSGVLSACAEGTAYSPAPSHFTFSSHLTFAFLQELGLDEALHSDRSLTSCQKNWKWRQLKVNTDNISLLLS